ncbi:MAG TPA: DUF1259 domain-containing protein, partial [Gemmatimonadaceae bacterium]|nr:DUF1259 domain-containing protein [Gemmatimonadaceae bacterium]
MRRSRFCVALALSFVVVPVAHAQRNNGAEDWSAVTKAIGRAGMLQPDGVMKFGFPRSDLDITLDGVKLKPALALGSWVAFKRTGRQQAMVMGDLVLAESEVSAVISSLQEKDVLETAVHNHLLNESPRVMYVHIVAHGDPVGIAKAIRAALDLTKTPPQAAPSAAPAFALDTAAIHRTLGYAGKVNGGVYQISIPRRERIRADGEVVPPSMGVSTAINFQPTDSGRAAITGDFVIRSSEVNRIIPILRANQIGIT